MLIDAACVECRFPLLLDRFLAALRAPVELSSCAFTGFLGTFRDLPLRLAGDREGELAWPRCGAGLVPVGDGDSDFEGSILSK